MKNTITITAQQIGDNIRRLRLSHGETQKELGEILGYGATTIANYESGYRMPDLETFLRIAHHYGAAISDFIDNANTDNPETNNNIDKEKKHEE